MPRAEMGGAGPRRCRPSPCSWRRARAGGGESSGHSTTARVRRPAGEQRPAARSQSQSAQSARAATASAATSSAATSRRGAAPRCRPRPGRARSRAPLDEDHAVILHFWLMSQAVGMLHNMSYEREWGEGHDRGDRRSGAAFQNLAVPQRPAASTAVCQRDPTSTLEYASKKVLSDRRRNRPTETRAHARPFARQVWLPQLAAAKSCELQAAPATCHVRRGDFHRYADNRRRRSPLGHAAGQHAAHCHHHAGA